jgi:hypothetical protein
MASGLYNSARAAFLRGEIDWEGADVRLLLVKDTYTFDATDVYVSDLVAQELTATDYARQSMAHMAVTGTNPTWADADDVTFAGLGGVTNQTIGGAVVYVYNASDDAAPLIAFIDLSDISTADMDTAVRFEDSHVFNWSA